MAIVNGDQQARCRRGRLRHGMALIIADAVVFLGCTNSCASDTQPHPPGLFGIVAPLSWAPVLLVLWLVGVAAIIAGNLIFQRARRE
jgi:hypothetical protein